VAASSRLGGAILIGLVVLAVVALVLYLAVFKDSGSDNASNASKSTPAPTATATATPKAVGQPIPLKGTGAARAASGLLALYQQNQQLLFALQVKTMPATPRGAKYGLWLSGGSAAKWIGDLPAVGKDGLLQVQGPRQGDTTFAKALAAHRQILITLETGSSRKKPGPALVRGSVPQS
jgi:hypothetical protein